MKGSEYCYMHGLGRIRGVCWWKNVTFHLILSVIGIVIAIIFGVFQLATGATSQKQDVITNGIRKIAEGQEDTRKTFEEAARFVRDPNVLKAALQQAMRECDETHYGVLIKEYPAGYIIFGVCNPPVIVLGNSRLLADYELKWDGAKILDLTERRMVLLFPEVNYRTIHFILSQCKFALYRSGPNEAYRGRFPGPFPHELHAEIIKDDTEGMVFVLGFKEPKEN